MPPARPCAAWLALLTAGCGALHTAVSDAQYGDRDQILQIGEDRIHFLAGGQGTHSVAFVHGNPGFGDEAWPHQVLVEDEFCWVRLDRPGHGSSTRHGDWPIDRQADLLARMLDERHPAILVAHGAGAAIALAFAQRHREQVTGLVLVAPLTRSEPPSHTAGSLYEVPVFGTLVQESLGTLAARHGSVPATLRRSYVGDGDAAIPERADGLFARGLSQFARPGQQRAAWHDDVAVAEAYAAMRGRQYEVPQPVVVLVGDADPIVDSTRHARLFAWCRPDTALQVVPGAAHMLHVTHPQAVANAIRYVDEWAGRGQRPPRAPDQPRPAAPQPR